MASDDLRARITEALNTTPAGFVQSSPDALAFHYEHEWNRHDRHQYMGSCALCRGEADTLTDAVMTVVTPELERLHRQLDDARSELYQLRILVARHNLDQKETQS